MQSNATVSFFVCTLYLIILLSWIKNGGLAPDILIMRRKWEERKLWKEISLQICSSLLPLAPSPSALSPVQPLNFYSQAAHQAEPLCGEQEAGLGACCLQAKASGYEMSAWKKVATFPKYEPKSNWQPCSMDPREITEPENPEQNGAQTWKPALSGWAHENTQSSLELIWVCNLWLWGYMGSLWSSSLML